MKVIEKRVYNIEFDIDERDNIEDTINLLEDMREKIVNSMEYPTTIDYNILTINDAIKCLYDVLTLDTTEVEEDDLEPIEEDL